MRVDKINGQCHLVKKNRKTNFIFSLFKFSGIFLSLISQFYSLSFSWVQIVLPHFLHFVTNVQWSITNLLILIWKVDTLANINVTTQRIGSFIWELLAVKKMCNFFWRTWNILQSELPELFSKLLQFKWIRCKPQAGCNLQTGYKLHGVYWTIKIWGHWSFTLPTYCELPNGTISKR